MPPQFCLGKSFANYGPTGPALVSTDTFADPDDIALWCEVAGERMQAARTTELIFSIPTLVAYLSSICPLYPGDLIFTGTPSGVGMARGRYLAPGETISLGRRRHRRAPQHMPSRCGAASGVRDMSDHTALRVERRGRVVILENQDPPRNRMTFEYMDELERAVIALRDDRDARAVVITAAGDEHFSVGMDLKQLMSGAPARGGFEAVLDQRLRVLSLIEQLDKPVIATMFGYCLGGGLELPLACHFRLAATEGARIGLPELDLGTVPAWGGTARLTRTVGRAHSLDMILRAKKIDGPTALAIGLVHELHPIAELKAKAVELAEELAAQPPIAVAGVLRAVVGAEHLPLENALRIERDAVRRCSSSADQIEGMTAFLEKRRPNFEGR